MQKLWGYVEQGNKSVTVGGLSSASTNVFQQSYPLATVTVYAAGTLTLSTIYSDNVSTPKANPFTASATGLWEFYAANGRYDVKFNGGSGSLSAYTVSDLLLYDSANSSLLATIESVTYSATPTFNAATASMFFITLTGNVTSSTISNATTGQIIGFSITQDATGSRTFTWPATVTRPPAIAPGASQRTNVMFIYDGSAWRQLSTTGDSVRARNLESIRFADQFSLGSAVGTQIDSALADLGGSPGLVIIPSDMGAGNQTAVLDNTRILDLRGDVGPNYQGSENQAYRKNVLLRARWTAALNSAQNYQTLYVYAEPFTGGYNTSPSPKTNYNVIYAAMCSRTIGQHGGYSASIYNYSNGDTQGAQLTAISYGSRLTGGDEGTVAVRADCQQGAEVMTGTVSSINSNTLTVSSSTTRFLGEGRPLINTTGANVYSTGSIASILGTPPTVEGTGGMTWAAQFGAGAKTNLFFSLDSETNGSLKYVVPIASITDDDTLVLEYVNQGSSQTWGGTSSTGTYKIFKGSMVTGLSANVGETSPTSPTITVSDGTQFTATDTVEQPLGYGFTGRCIKAIYNRELASSVNGDAIIETGALSGSKPPAALLTYTGEMTAAIISISSLGTTYRPTHFLKVTGNSPSTWISMQDTVNNSFHTMLQLYKNSGTWSLTYNKNGDEVKFDNQTTVSIEPTADNANEFQVTSSGAVPHFRVGYQYIFTNNGIDLFGYSDNATTIKWRFTGSTGALATSGSIQTKKTDVAVANGANANVDIGAAGFVKLTGPTGVFSISGFTGGADGRHLTVYNSVAFAWTITNNATSTAANRILTLTGADVTLGARASAATFVYDSTQSLWILVATY